MNRRDFTLTDRDIALRRAFEALKARTPKGEMPPDAVVPAWDGKGGLICPRCGGTCRVPIAWNPWRNCEERLVLVAGKCNECPICGAGHYVTETLARLHNEYFYPEDYRQLPKKKREDD